MSPTCSGHSASAATLPQFSRDVDFGRLFADLAADISRAADADALTAAVQSLTTVALRM
jgi:hypothetical protein